MLISLFFCLFRSTQVLIANPTRSKTAAMSNTPTRMAGFSIADVDDAVKMSPSSLVSVCVAFDATLNVVSKISISFCDWLRLALDAVNVDKRFTFFFFAVECFEPGKALADEAENDEMAGVDVFVAAKL